MFKGSTEKRLLKYAALYKKGIILGIICLMIATALELAGPYIAKVIIDDHILSIEGTWHEVEETNNHTVSYQNRNFIREDRLNSEQTLGTVTIVAVEKEYFLVEEDVPLEGSRKVENGTLTIGADQSVQVDAKQLSLQELYSFFKPEQKPILLLLGLY